MAETIALPEVVYHYTSMDTLLKIYESGTVRATSIRYLNDISERDFFWRELGHTIRTSPSLNEEVKNTAIALLKPDQKTQHFLDLPFVASFSKEADSLPQWRAYCPQGNGVAIGFRTDSLRQAVAESSSNLFSLGPTMSFSPVEYLYPSDAIALAMLLQKAYQQALDWNEENRSLEHPSSTDLEGFIESALESRASLVKHRSFETEAEYRLVVNHVRHFGKVHHRASRSTLIPYVVVDVPNPDTLLPSRSSSSTDQKPHFIEEVWVGPSPNVDLSREALQSLFWRNQHFIDINASRVPYRDTI